MVIPIFVSDSGVTLIIDKSVNSAYSAARPIWQLGPKL
jgi:hypothetical protein